jgi:hypothetical protein
MESTDGPYAFFKWLHRQTLFEGEHDVGVSNDYDKLLAVLQGF